MSQVSYIPEGDRAITIHFGDRIQKDTHIQIMNLTTYLLANPFEGMLEVTPSYTAVTVFYDPTRFSSLSPYEEVMAILKSIISSVMLTTDHKATIVTIPVCYGGEYGPDLSYVADYHKLTEQQVIDIHSQQEYLVYMLGFAPGFPYLGGMSKEIATPRKNTPRLKIPVGSVGIGGEQTGIYPIESPGGWQLIGRTPIRLFDPYVNQPTRVNAGDIIRFEPITSKQFEKWGGDSTCR